ncbi:unnamed protein product [Closterium sp. NIES-53]
MEAEGSDPAGPSGSGGVRGAGEAGRGVAGGSASMASVSASAKDDVKAFNLEKFSGDDWASWSFRMELLFNHYGLLEVMDGELKRPASEGANKEWDRRSKDGFFLLSQCLSSNQLHHIKHLIKEAECGPKAWRILKDVHAPSSEAMVVVLKRQLHAVKINEGDAVQGAFDQLRDLYVKLSAAGVDYPEKIKCYKALSLLLESWGPLVVNLNGMKDSWSLEWIRAQVLQEEFRRKELTAAAGEGGGSAYGMKGFKGRGSKKWKAKEGSGGEQHSGGKRGNKGGKRCGGKSMGEGVGSEEGDGGAGRYGGMFYHVGEACSEDMVVPASKVALHRSSHWVIDTGAFMTMTNREDLLDEIRPSKAATVVSATGQVVPVRGEGRAMFMGADGRLVGLKRVLLVPGLCANLLSTKALSEAGMKMEMLGTKAFKTILDGRVLWDLRGGKDMHRSMWEIPVLPWKEAAACLAAGDVRGGRVNHVDNGGGGDDSDGGLLGHGGAALPSVTPSTGETDWLTAHRRFGHVALPQLQQLFKEERVQGLRIKGEPKEVGSCETFLTSKFSRFPFHSVEGKSSDPVELVHVDLVGPMKVKGDGGALYSMTMVDDNTRLTWSFPLAKKSDAARVIIEEWLPMVERESGKRVKAIRSDRGGEFLGAEFRSWLKRHGIKQQLTTAYTPQSNGVAERANRTILEGGRTMLVDSGLPLRFWPLAIRHATVIKNRVLTHVGGQHWVPMEKWRGKKPLVDMLQVFGCMGLVHVPKEKRDKLQAAAVWAVHLGLAQGSKGWLMWDPKANTIFTIRDAKFMEGLMFKEWLERGRSKVTIPLGIEVGTNDPPLIPIELSSSSEVMEVSHDLGGAEGEAIEVEGVLQQEEAPVAERGDAGEEVQQPTSSPSLPSRRTTQGKRGAVRGGAKEGAAKERPKRAAQPRDFSTLAGDDREAWLASREDEFQSLMENGTWTLTDLPPGRKALDCTWILRVKTDAEGKLERRKTRLVIKGFQQREGVDFKEVFAPVAKAPTLRVLLAAAAVCGWKVEQMDVKTAFLYGVVDEEIYMKQPEGYDDGSGRVCRLNKALYGLKQAPRCWYARLVEALEALGFKVNECDESLFMTEGKEEKVFLLVYVDDILLFSPSLERIKEVQGKLKETFKCKTLGPVGYYLGLHVERDEVKGWLRLHQHKYHAAMGERYGLEEGRSVKTPLPSGFQLHLDEEEGEVLEPELQRRFQSMVGSLMYASVNTRPDISFAVSQLARVVSRPLQEHLDAAERLVRYCMATSRVGLQYSVHGQLKQKGVEEVSTKTERTSRRSFPPSRPRLLHSPAIVLAASATFLLLFLLVAFRRQNNWSELVRARNLRAVAGDMPAAADEGAQGGNLPGAHFALEAAAEADSRAAADGNGGAKEGLRVVMVSLEYRAGTFSGNGVYSQSLVRSLIAHGHSVMVVSAAPPPRTTPLPPPNPSASPPEPSAPIVIRLRQQRPTGSLHSAGQPCGVAQQAGGNQNAAATGAPCERGGSSVGGQRNGAEEEEKSVEAERCRVVEEEEAGQVEQCVVEVPVGAWGRLDWRCCWHQWAHRLAGEEGSGGTEVARRVAGFAPQWALVVDWSAVPAFTAIAAAPVWADTVAAHGGEGGSAGGCVVDGSGESGRSGRQAAEQRVQAAPRRPRMAYLNFRVYSLSHYHPAAATTGPAAAGSAGEREGNKEATGEGEVEGETEAGRERAFYREKESKAVAMADVVTALSTRDARYLADSLGARRKAGVEPHALLPPLREDIRVLAAGQEMSTTSWPSERLYLVCCVRLSPEKNAVLLPPLLRLLAPHLAALGVTPLLCAGTAATRGAFGEAVLQEVVAAAPGAVVVDGFMGPDRMAQLYSQVIVLHARVTA